MFQTPATIAPAKNERGIFGGRGRPIWYPSKIDCREELEYFCIYDGGSPASDAINQFDDYEKIGFWN